MRLTRYLFAVIIIILFFVPTSFAATPVETLINQQLLDQAEEKTEIEQAINLSKVSPKSFLVEEKDNLDRNELKDVKSSTELEYGKAYKVVSADKNVIQALLDGTNLSLALQAAPYHWEVPVFFQEGSLDKPVASFTIAKHDNAWQIVEIGGYLSPEQSYFSSDSNNLINLWKNKSLNTADSFVHFRIPSLHSDFLYIASEEQEYFVPLIHGREELYGLKSETIYTKEEVAVAIVPIIKERSENSLITGYSSSEAGSPYSENDSNKIPIIFILGIFFAMSAIYGYRKIKVKA